MNKVKLLSYSLMVMPALYGADTSINALIFKPGTLHIRVQRLLEKEIKKNSSIQTRPWSCGKSKAIIEKCGRLSADILFFPPFKRFFSVPIDNVTLFNVTVKAVSVTPIMAPIFGLWLVGRSEYVEYMRKRSKLIDFKYEVMCLQRYLNLHRDNRKNDELSEKVNWFLEEGYEQAHQCLMNEVCDSLNSTCRKRYEQDLS
jgi:hypothetical protein